ncbi:UDP-GlcNAc:betaGal beta-1,3-N-acetylglucosaminyltransferase-like protein 1 [Chamberlinius hualienensis]
MSVEVAIGKIPTCSPGLVDVSIVLPVYNAEEWLDDCLQSVSNQTFTGILELSVYNDGSTDSSLEILESWKLKLPNVTISGHDDAPRGVGYAKNRAVEQSHGQFLCFLDADDIMENDRIMMQWQAALLNLDAIIGCQFKRIPNLATLRYTDWANNLSPEQLYTQVFMSHGPTLIMPTWFCSRQVYHRVGGFLEDGKGTPEDLIFFYRHLDLNGKLFRVNHCLLTYRYHQQATTFTIHEDVIWKLRINRLEDKVLSKWNSFTIWNAGKQGRKFYRCLTKESRKKVVAFCDLDQKKIDQGVYVFQLSKEKVHPRVPIVHFRQAESPFILCMKLGLTNGHFEDNLNSLGLKEGVDYYHFN